MALVVEWRTVVDSPHFDSLKQTKRSPYEMPYGTEKLERIYRKTDGYCWYCDARLAFTNYGLACERGAWEVDHSVPRSRGGTGHMNNLNPVCYFCNREKGNMLGRTFSAYIERNWASKESYRAAMRRKYC